MGLDKFWLVATTLAAITSVHTPTPSEGTQPAGHVQLEHRFGASQQDGPSYGESIREWTDVVAHPEMGGTVPPRPSVRSVSHLIDTQAPVFEIVKARDEYGSVLIRRTDPTSSVTVPEPTPAEDPAPSAVDATLQAQAIQAIRALTGLSWPRIAHLVGVERQTIYRWRSGEPADEERLQRAIEVLGVLKEAREEHGAGNELRAWLNRVAPLHAASPYQLLSDGRYDEARFLAMLAPSRVTSISDLARDTSRWDRHFAEEERAYRD